LEQFTDALQSPLITQGLAQFGTDHYAVLAVPMDASIPEIRRIYRNIVRSLHPDRFGRDTEGKKEAEQILSRLVNPAFEVLTNENQRRDYDRLIQSWATRMLERRYTPVYPQLLIMQQAKNLSELQTFYAQAILKENNGIYKDLNDLVNLTAANQLSIYNLGYILGLVRLTEAAPPAAAPETAPPAAPTPTAPKVVEPTRNAGASFAASHFDRGKMLLDRRLYREAVQSLKEAVRLAPDNANYHAHLGQAYLRQGLPGMAKAEFSQALVLDPNEPLAKKEIAKAQGVSPAPNPANKTTKNPDPAKDDSIKGALQDLWTKLNKPL